MPQAEREAVSRSAAVRQVSMRDFIEKDFICEPRDIDVEIEFSYIILFGVKKSKGGWGICVWRIVIVWLF